MKRTLDRALGGLSLTPKVILITAAVGLVSWVLAGWYQAYTLKDIYQEHLMEQLGAEAFEGRNIVHRRFNSFFKLGKLIVSNVNFSTYLDKVESRWAESDRGRIRIWRQVPPWFPDASLLNLFPNARYALLIDPDERIREIYIRNFVEYPEFLRNPAESIPQMRWNSSFLTIVDGKPYAITSEILTRSSGETRAILLLVTHIDDEFIFAAKMPDFHDPVALVEGITSTVLASSNHKLIPPGTEVSTIEDRYLVIGESFFDYGNSDLLIRFVAFTSKDKIQAMTESFISQERFKRAASIFVVISIFSILMVRISRRIGNVTRRIEDFSSKALGGEPEEPPRGDELVKLERQFHNLTETVMSRTTELKEKEFSYRTLAENLPGIAYRLFLRGERRVQFFNAMLEPVTGYSEEELHAGDVCCMESITLPEDRSLILDSVKKAVEEGTPYIVEYRIRRKDNAILYCIERGKPIRGDDGEASRIDGIILDITERKKAEMQVLAARARLEHLLSQSSAVIYSCAVESPYRASFVSKNVSKLSGYESSDFTKNPAFWSERIHPEDAERVLGGVSKIFDMGFHSREYRWKGKDEKYIWLMDEIRLVRTADGKPVEMVGAWFDITERKKAEEALALAQFALESAADSVFWVAPDAKIIYANDSACRTLGYSKEEMLSLTVHDIDPNYPVDEWRKHWETVKGEGHSVLETLHRARDGRVFPVEITVNYVKYGNEEYQCVFARDISDRKKANDALRKSEERFKMLFEYAPDAYFLMDLSGRFMDMNKAAVEMSGYDKEELLDKDLFEIGILSSGEMNKATSLQSRSREGEPTGPEEFVVTRKDGSKTSVEVRTYPVDMEDRTLILGIARDISERIRAEMKLKEGKQFLSNILESIQDGLCIIGSDNVLVMANRTMERWFGHRGPVVGRKCFEVIRGKGAACNPCPSAETLRTGQSSFDTVAFRRPSGTRGWLDIYTFPLRAVQTGEVIGVILYLRDVTDKVTFQSEAARTAQLASLGELAAGVAHEINNPINGIINYAQILANKIPEGREGEISRRIIKEGDRVSEIVRSLLSFARDEGGWKTAVSLSEMLTEVLSLIGSQLRKEGIRLTADVKQDLPEVYVSRQQIEQVFLNIMNNSRHALRQKYPNAHENKIIEILAEPVSFGGAYYVRVTFRDKGTGIPKVLLDKVTSPFFTTKPRGSGTGLGLSISQNIINNHGGRLSINSVEGEFTQVTIDLPQWREREG